ncbi:hypothetical protein RQP46_002296 [Phenoliferia psychrophenolica]
MLLPRDTQLDFNIFGYIPSKSVAIVFIAIFCVLTLAHVGLLARSRYWFSVVTILGGIAEIIGWVGRLRSAENVASLNAFLVQQICLILAPCYFSATLYATLGSYIPVGGAMAAIALNDNKASATGTHTMVGGIVLQLVSMIIFCALAWEFVARERQDGTGLRSQRGFRPTLLALGIAVGSFWILVRCIYRTVELSQGWTGYLITHQAYFIGLDSIPMVDATPLPDIAQHSIVLTDWILKLFQTRGLR